MRQQRPRICALNLAVAVLCLLPAAARAHAFGERFDLPLPLGYFVAGAAATVALSFIVVACCGNIWPALDPWRALFEWMDAGARRLGRANGLHFGMTYPTRLGAWPAVFLLLFFVWIEVLYPKAVVPLQLAWITLAWSAVTLLGMACFGAPAWCRNADVFALYFATLGRFAPVAAGAMILQI